MASATGRTGASDVRGNSGPCWVRMASGTGGPCRAPAVTMGMKESQVTGHSRLPPRKVKRREGGFESHLSVHACELRDARTDECSWRPDRPRQRPSWVWFEHAGCWGTTMALVRDSPSIQGDVPGPDPARAPPNKAIAPAGLACRGAAGGGLLASQGPPGGAPLPPRAGVCPGPHRRARFCHCSAQLLCTAPHDPVSLWTTSPPAPLLIRADATQANHTGRIWMRRIRLKTARSAVRSRPCPPHRSSSTGLAHLASRGPVLQVEASLSRRPPSWLVASDNLGSHCGCVPLHPRTSELYAVRNWISAHPPEFASLSP